MNLKTWIYLHWTSNRISLLRSLRKWLETARDLIRNGDMFQCVLSQRFSAEVTGNPFDFYRNLRVTNPSNYLYFYDFGDYQIIGASPESLVSVKNGIVTTNPIAGTRPKRGYG